MYTPRQFCDAISMFQGYCTERIFRTALAAKLREGGFMCHEEVVLPVLYNNSYVGHNRLDILLEEMEPAGHKHIVALELKCLGTRLACDRMGTSTQRQAQGYVRCLEKIFPMAKSVTVFIVNLPKDTHKPEVKKVIHAQGSAEHVHPKHKSNMLKVCRTRRNLTRLCKKF